MQEGNFDQFATSENFNITIAVHTEELQPGKKLIRFRNLQPTALEQEAPPNYGEIQACYLRKKIKTCETLYKMFKMYGSWGKII